MKHLLIILLATICAVSGYAQTIKSLGYNTTNGQVVYSGTNTLTFTNPILFSGTANLTGQGGATTVAFSTFRGANFEVITSGATTNKISNGTYDGTNYLMTIQAVGTNVAIFRPTATELLVPLQFNNTTNSATTRTNLGLGWSALTNTNAANALIGYNTADNRIIQPSLSATFDFGAAGIRGDKSEFGTASGSVAVTTNGELIFYGTNSGFNFGAGASASQLRSDLGLPLPALTNTSNVTMMRALSGSTNTNHPFSGSVSVVGTNNTNTLVFSNGILQEVQ